MTTKKLLACATTGATKYIQKAVNPKNKTDYQKLKKLFDEHQFVTNNFDDTELNLITFDWQSLERDRNWWWQLQALPFLNWYVNSLELQTEEERTRYLSLCLDAIYGWIKNAKQNKESPLVWHDHASAFRVRNITNWLLFCDTAGLWLNEEAQTEIFASLIIEHLDWLQEDKHYSKHTNHGFDQAMIGLTIGLMFDYDDFESYRQCNRDRLKGEVKFAFTDEGVHKENSPGYQKMMLARLQQLRTLAPLGEQEVSQMGERYIEQAEAFLRAITLPNGYLPMIGDTRGGDKGLPYEQQEKIDVLDYSASGYAIVRGVDNQNINFFILLKNTHESNYHRHDDDMMVYIVYNNKVVLGDGGLFSHQEKDDRRKLLRSYLSHSVPYISAKAVRDVRKLSASPSISRCGGLRFEMESMMFGKLLRREVDISTSPELSVRISDQAVNDSSEEVWSNLFFETPSPVSIDQERAKIYYDDFVLDISYESGVPIKFLKGTDDVEEVSSAYVSEKYGEIKPAMRLMVRGSPLVLSFVYV
ncbi:MULTISPECIES: heparinase II/III family protein [unclassified Halomonas]|uniref:heparinase II/III family protein n=1 Tax=unclassified Halomonas TaxID=2609666 RepID=UPI004034A492